MVRTQIRLDETQHRRLKALAVRRSKSVSELVRDGVDQVLAAAERERRWNRVWQVVGTCHDRDGASDVAVNHDTYLAEIYSGAG